MLYITVQVTHAQNDVARRFRSGARRDHGSFLRWDRSCGPTDLPGQDVAVLDVYTNMMMERIIIIIIMTSLQDPPNNTRVPVHSLKP